MISRMSRSSRIFSLLAVLFLITGITLLLASVPIPQAILILLTIAATGYLTISSASQIQGAQLRILEDRSNLLQQENQQYRNCLTVQADIEKLENEKAQLSHRVAVLKEQEDELTLRILRTRQENSNLKVLEERQQESEVLKTLIEESQGRLKALKNQVKEYELHRDGLKHISSQYLQKKEELDQVREQINRLNQQVTELELFRSTYDALSQDFQSLEKRKQHLEAEIPRLQQEHDRILGAIRGLESQAHQVQQLQAEITELEAGKRYHQTELTEVKRSLRQIEAERSSLKTDNEALTREIENKRTKLSEIRRQIEEDKEESENNIKIAFQALKTPVDLKADRAQSFDSESDFLNEFRRYLAQKGLVFPDRIINAFHTSLKVQDISALVILAGISGTGKSELPQAYSEFMGAPLVMLPVQPRWDSPQDLQGFYNYIEKKYKPTELMRYLYQHQHSEKLRGRIVMVLLDEMNLARVEYYFSDFLSKLESRRNESTYLELEAGSLRLEDRDKQVLIPKEFLFVGTMNEDETTQSLSDKVLDRANVLTFGRPPELKLRGSQHSRPPRPTDYLTWQLFEQWIQEPTPDTSLTEKVKGYVDRANDLMEALGRPFAHRVYQAIAKYVANYPGAQQDDNIMNQAISDQFGQKLLPKLRGVMVEDHTVQPYLNQMQSLIDEFGDKALTDAFRKACAGQYGQFQWKGMIYPLD